MVVLGSREQLCIHPDVSLLQGKTQTNACHSLCQKRTKRYCTHYPRVSGNFLIKPLLDLFFTIWLREILIDIYLFLPFAEFVKNNPDLGEEPIDIEDLVNIGKNSGPLVFWFTCNSWKMVVILLQNVLFSFIIILL